MGILNQKLYIDVSAAPFTYKSYDVLAPAVGCYTSPGIFVPPCVTGLVPSDACPSTISGGNNNSSSTLLDQIKNYNNQIALFQNLLNDGNSKTLLISINTKVPGQIKNDLLAKSPYLSDDVLIAAINKNLPPGIIKDILIPNSPLTSSVKTVLASVSLPNGTRNQINAAQTGISARQNLEEEISFYKGASQTTTNQLVRNYLDSSMVDSAIAVLKTANNVDALCALIPIDIKARDFTAANAKLTTLSAIADSMFAVNPLDTKVPPIKTFCEFHHAVAGIEARPGSYFSITPAEKQVLISLAQSNLPIAINAQSILKMVFNQNFPRLAEPVHHSGANNKVMAQEQVLAKKTENGKLYPNPNNGNMMYDYTLQDGEQGMLIIYNTVGQLINKYQLSEGSHTLQISEASLENGIYFYNAMVNGRVISSDKLIIIK